MPRNLYSCALWMLTVGLLLGGVAGSSGWADVDVPPRITHQPVSLAMEGQPLMIRATVSVPGGEVKYVRLYYSVSRDAAPFRIEMQPAGTAMYVAAIPESVFTGIQGLSYYIEAVSSAGVTAETSWTPVRVRQLTGATKGTASPTEPERSRWVTPTLIAGGAAVVVGGLVLAGNKGHDSSFNSAAVGAYSGTATTCYQTPEGSSSCDSSAVSIEIDSDGKVRSSTLRAGQTLEGHLSGSGFILSATIQDADATGEIQYIGTVIDGRIAGSIQGSVTTTTGMGSYSGTFSASKK